VKIIRLNYDFPITILAIWQIPLEVFEERLEYLGWDLSRKGRGNGRPDYMALSPDGKQRLTVMAHNWGKNWYDVKRKILQNRDLAFVFETKFIIPKNFNFKTQKIEEPQTQYKIQLIPLRAALPSNIEDYEIFINNKWHKVEIMDWENYTIMTTEHEIITIPETNIQIRKQIS
jgi:hypothetical protein